MQEGVYLLFEAIEGVVVESYWLTRTATRRFLRGRRDGGGTRYRTSNLINSTYNIIHPLTAIHVAKEVLLTLTLFDETGMALVMQSFT